MVDEHEQAERPSSAPTKIHAPSPDDLTDNLCHVYAVNPRIAAHVGVPLRVDCKLCIRALGNGDRIQWYNWLRKSGITLASEDGISSASAGEVIPEAETEAPPASLPA